MNCRSWLIAFTLCVVTLFAGLAQGQNFTTVTGTVTDPNGIPYANGLITFILGPLPFSSSPSVGGGPVAGYTGPFALNGAGFFSVSLASNAAITPGSTQWTPQVCANPNVPTPFGSGLGGNCFTASPITISGSTQDISPQLAAVALPLTQRANLARIFNTLPAPTIVTTANNFTVTMVTAPSIPTTGTTYRFTAYVSETVVGTSCSGNPSALIAIKFQDPNEVSAASTTQLTYTITTNGSLGRLTPVLTTPNLAFRAAAGTVVQYTATLNAGASCSPNPTVQIYPLLEAM
jgi:hypothetical protein